MKHLNSILFAFILLLLGSTAQAKAIEAKNISEKLNTEVLRIAKELGDLMASKRIPVYTNDSMERVINNLEVDFHDSTTQVLGLYVIYKDQSNPGNSHQSSQIYALSPFLALQRFGIEFHSGYGFISFKDWQRHASKDDIQLLVTLANLLSGTSSIYPQFPIETPQFEENEDINIRRNYSQDDKKVLLTQFNTDYLGKIILNRAQEVFDQVKKENGTFFFDAACSESILSGELADHLAVDEVHYTNTEHTDSIVTRSRDLSFYRYPILLANENSLGFSLRNNPKSSAYIKKDAFNAYLAGWEKDLFDIILE